MGRACEGERVGENKEKIEFNMYRAQEEKAIISIKTVINFIPKLLH